MKLTGKNFAVDINIASFSDLLAEVGRRFDAREGFAVATVNLDHVTKLEMDPVFREAYREQDLVVADGNPIVWVARLAGQPLELMPGSDLIIPLAKSTVAHKVSVALIGSSDESLSAAGEALKTAVPGLEIAYSHAPAYGFDPEGDAARAILAELNESGAQLAFLALGAPKQERFAALARQVSPHVGFASIGAGLDFLSGAQVRAPKWMRDLALEWFWRLINNPRRLLKRYTLSALVLPGLAWRTRRAAKSG